MSDEARKLAEDVRDVMHEEYNRARDAMESGELTAEEAWRHAFMTASFRLGVAVGAMIRRREDERRP